MSTEIMNYDSPAMLEAIPTTSLTEFQQSAFTEPVNRLVARIQRDSKTDTALHVGRQLQSEFIAGKILNIIRVGYAFAPATDMSGNPVWETDENGNIIENNGVAVQKMSRFPVCHFKEAPGWWYNGGKMLDGILESLIAECGDSPEDVTLPNVNAALQEVGGLRCYFDWKESKKNRGQRYMNIIVA